MWGDRSCSGSAPSRTRVRVRVNALKTELLTLLKTERIQVGILHFKPHSHGLAGEGTEIGIPLPRHDTLQIVAIHCVAIVEREAG